MLIRDSTIIFFEWLFSTKYIKISVVNIAVDRYIQLPTFS